MGKITARGADRRCRPGKVLNFGLPTVTKIFWFGDFEACAHKPSYGTALVCFLYLSLSSVLFFMLAERYFT